MNPRSPIIWSLQKSSFVRSYTIFKYDIIIKVLQEPIAMQLLSLLSRMRSYNRFSLKILCTLKFNLFELHLVQWNRTQTVLDTGNQNQTRQNCYFQGGHGTTGKDSKQKLQYCVKRARAEVGLRYNNNTACVCGGVSSVWGQGSLFFKWLMLSWVWKVQRAFSKLQREREGQPGQRE